MQYYLPDWVRIRMIQLSQPVCPFPRHKMTPLQIKPIPEDSEVFKQIEALANMSDYLTNKIYIPNGLP